MSTLLHTSQSLHKKQFADLASLLALLFASFSENVCQFANMLKRLGVRKGDTVTIYLPMIPEIVYAMLACTRIGAVHR